MSYPAAALIVLLSSSVAGLASYLIARRVSLEFRQRHYEVGSVVFLQLGVIYAVLLAFVFSEVWGEYNTAAQAINTECSGLHASAMLAHDFADRAGAPFDRAVITYVRTVIVKEWPLMEDRRDSVEASNDLEAMLDAVANLEPTRPRDAAIRDQVLSLLSGVHEQRETRIFQMTQSLPPLLWALLILYTGILVGLILFASIERPASHVLFTTVFTGCTVLILVVIRMLDHPFEGALALQPTDFQRVLEKVLRLAGASNGSM